MQKKVIVIGGGFAGLSAAAFLANNKFKVTLLEASPKLGGRAYSFLDKDSNVIIDNGQHILMGCYRETLNFLNLIGAEKNFAFQKAMKVSLINPKQVEYKLNLETYFYPINLLVGLLSFKALSICNRLKLLKLFAKIYFCTDDPLLEISVDQWLSFEKQNDRIKKVFWEFLAIGTLNTDLENASAKVFVDVLKNIFFKGKKGSGIILPKRGLSEAYCDAAKKFIEGKEGVIQVSEPVVSIISNEKRVTDIVTTKRVLKKFDYVVFAIPPYSIKKINNENININSDLVYSSIISVHIFLKKNNLKEEFYGLIDSRLHWVFNHKTHITVVISSATEYINLSADKLMDIITCELNKYLSIKKEEINKYKIIKEKRATFISNNYSLKNRQGITSELNNLFFVGDWVDTGLPSTIEGAVKSSRILQNVLVKEEDCF